MLWFGLRKDITALKERLDRFEVALPATVAALTNAADLYSRAAARAERTKPRNGDTEQVTIGEIIKRRGGF